MSDENYEENMTEEQKEAVKKLRTRIPVENGKELIVSAEVNPKMIKESEAFRKEAKKLAEFLTQEGEPTDSSDITPENKGEKISLLYDLKKMHKQARRDADPTSKHSSGTLTIEGNRQNDDNEADEWDSAQEMLRDLFALSKVGTKRQKAKSKAIIEKIHRKIWQGHEERNVPFKTIEIKGEEDVDTGKEKGIVEMLNEEFRKRERLKREKKNAEN